MASLEGQRALLGDAAVDAALGPLRVRLASLAERPMPGQVRRQVTVLFLDFVGSTALAQQLDPEDVHAVLDGALAASTRVVEAHQGKVLQYAGDNLLAAFGADETREDDPERAVIAGLALLAEGRHASARVAQRHGHAGFGVRVGVHTGPVLLGGGVDAEHSIRGNTVNVAARMEQSAPPGALRISHDTYRHVRGVFDVEPQPPLHLKGIDQPIVTYLVRGAKPRAFRVATRGIEGVQTCMVGRNAELDRLKQLFERLHRDPALIAVCVVADAGVGKSRLLFEFENWAETRPEPFVLFKGRAHPQTRTQAYGLLRDVLAWWLQIADDDSMDSAKRKFEQGILPMLAARDGADIAQAHTHLLGHLIGLDFADSRFVQGIARDGLQLRSRAFLAAARFFAEIAARHAGPLVMLVEDLHLADEGSLDFVQFLEQAHHDLPMLMLTTTRPALFEAHATWRCGERIDLNPLDKCLSQELANELLKKLGEIPDALRELITGGAEGNPYYMEELVKMLVDDGAINTDDEPWRVVPQKLLATRVPQTLTGVLQARLDALKPAEKLALQQASVIGHVFWDQALAAIDADAPACLPAQPQRGLVVAHRETSLDGMREYAFQHHLLHQVTYDTVLRRMRRDCHAKAAEWLAGLRGARANDFLGAAAEHFERAGDSRRASDYLAKAAEHAGARYMHAAALTFIDKALALAAPEPTGASDADAGAGEALRFRWRLLAARERSLHIQGRRTEQRADIDSLQRVAESLDDDQLRGEVCWRRAKLAMDTADPRAQEPAARNAMAFAERVGDDDLRLRAQQLLANALALLGDLVAAESLVQDGLAMARRLGRRYHEAVLLNTLSVIAGSRDDVVLAFETDRQLLPIARELGDARGLGITLGNLGLSWLKLGALDQAGQHLQEGLQLNQAVGDRLSESNQLCNLSQLALYRGDAGAALAHARAALEISIAVEDRRTQVFAMCALGNAELAAGRPSQAAEAFERARATALEVASPTRHDACAGLARAALARDDLPGALAWVDELAPCLSDADELAGAEQPRLIEWTCHQVFARAGDARAATVLAAARAALDLRAASLTDAALRAAFLHQVPEHRAIMVASGGSSDAAHADRMGHDAIR